MHERAVLGGRGQAGEERGRVDHSADLGLVEEPPARDAVALGEPLDLVLLDRDGEGAGALEVAVHAVAGDRLLDAVEVLDPEALEGVVLGGPAGEPVLPAVGQARLDEAAVAPGGGPADRARLEQDHAPPRVALLARRALQSPE